MNRLQAFPCLPKASKRRDKRRIFVDTKPDETKWERGITTPMLQALGPVVYAIRCKDGAIKIGHTTDYAMRRRSFDTRPGATLALMPGTVEDEQEIHERLIAHRAHGQEYYHETPEVVAVVNEMRRAFGMGDLPANKQGQAYEG